MGRVEACICCQEIEAVKNKNIEAVTSGKIQEEPTGITQHPGFHPVCINRWVLQTAWFQYKQQYKHPYDGPEHKVFRHTDYRQLARFFWGFLLNGHHFGNVFFFSIFIVIILLSLVN